MVKLTEVEHLLISIACTTKSVARVDNQIIKTSLVATKAGHENFYEEGLTGSNVNLYPKGFLPIFSVQSKNSRDPSNMHVLPRGIVRMAEVINNDEQSVETVVTVIGHQNAIQNV